MYRGKFAALVAAGVLVSSPALVACDKEDERDLQEIGEEVEDTGKQVEDAVDEADSDGKDD